MSYYQCPVCGYDKMIAPPEQWYICSCCGTEFENDDFEMSHAELRQRWIDNGMQWFSAYSVPPVGWNPLMQLESAFCYGLGVGLITEIVEAR